ncbi:hypothetical protein TcasGA2_TC011688 [Tribolium castaneum]|uniref:Swi5-dependent recombination DNA repair protein 1 homolog n=1 Tax=Tribolium castaneum TaxID=7070 RepID=D6X0H3_TRICA|nr:PREDICTED: uncharacterized protein LOC103314354 [Tribolium castaneum]XP_008198410.1 PREDICTED: uncharacterized protein LOC103314354 [Tribolium castaneum]EFA09574.1 hypothetical protein TcasGA2_TC011688 [Tribolium castaneum]|eukprot:XP_008198409.1 PREDICTED: uncharacterized protein LOC103314354 [Tribolium castaneum]
MPKTPGKTPSPTLTPIGKKRQSISKKQYTPLKENNSNSDDFENLEKIIKDKEQLIDELKRAEIFKKKNNLKELEKLTALWKAGCMSALNDLLALQPYGITDMATLLMSLNVEPNLITLSEDGDLV